ncbi:hypothetical protein ACFSC6_09560 [Rufibacter sediminis]|uniref:Uncharacterized protein n=1 Tax=Rufibacter sediminis TaxID=2762756 RepID=A0ABR6VXD1_9BACT|nr:hypothetical protein [Rufibacter sediminis]MBC3541864.1 hypothetical protein [Rufibacter sediminis]
MNKTCSLPKVVRTWALLFSVPLYMGASALWLKEEIKDVLSEKEEKMIADVKKQVNKALADKRTKRKTFLLP